ncbi:MAG TPA: hypothetical protein VF067_01370 [Sphingomicrobium sp.]
MVDYRIYCLDSTGNISFADWFEAADDGQAVAKARQMKNGSARCEVWRSRRLVATLGAQDLAN